MNTLIVLAVFVLKLIDMAAKPIKMEQLKLILRLHQKGYSIKGIVRQTGISRNTVKKYLANQIDDKLNLKTLATTAFNSDSTAFVSTRYERLLEHFKSAEGSLTRTGVTRQLLWQEYKQEDDNGYNYSQYCYHFGEYMRHKEVVMHLEHKAGHEIMMDFAGKKLSYVDINTGELIPCQVFISVLPYSGLIYCKAVHTQGTYDFIECVNSMLKYYGGASQTILCDNLKTAVTRPDRYEPVFTELCYQLGEHYNTCFSATRPYKPRDKAMVEKAVNIVYNHIYGPLRNDTFHSLQHLNAAIAQQLAKLNDKKYKGSAYSRLQLFHEQEQKLLIPLPTEAFKPKKVVQLTVQRNYHIQLSENHHYYSVPYTYVGKKVKVLYDNCVVEIYLNGERIAIHQKNSLSKAYHTIADHMPSNHQQALVIQGWTKDDLLRKASNIGLHALKVAEHILSSSIYPEQNFKSCHGMIMLQNKYPKSRIDNACKRALNGTRIRYATIRDILLKGLDNQLNLFDEITIPKHDNIRGSQEYH
jgi:transposase